MKKQYFYTPILHMCIGIALINTLQASAPTTQLQRPQRKYKSCEQVCENCVQRCKERRDRLAKKYGYVPQYRQSCKKMCKDCKKKCEKWRAKRGKLYKPQTRLGYERRYYQSSRVPEVKPRIAEQAPLSEIPVAIQGEPLSYSDKPAELPTYEQSLDKPLLLQPYVEETSESMQYRQQE